MALQLFAKPADLMALVPEVDEASATLTLTIVSGAIRSSIGWDVDKVTNAVYAKTLRPGSRATSVVLPALNVTAVSALEVDGVAQSASAYRVTPAGVIYLDGVSATKTIEVTYTAGWQATPTDQRPSVFRQVALEYASSLAGNPSGMKSYAMGGTSETFGDRAQTMASADERLDAYRVNQ
jgi:hypothetical protein